MLPFHALAYLLTYHTFTVVQEGHTRMEESHFELHALLVKEQQKNEARDLQLTCSWSPDPNPMPNPNPDSNRNPN